MGAGRENRFFPKGRIEALCDGIFAIVMTLLVLDLRAPWFNGRLGRGPFLEFISGIGEPLFNFAVSFVVLSMLWIWHHRQFREILKMDSFALAVNLSFLAVVSLVPFSTSVLSRFMDLWEADLIFHANIMLAGLLLVLNWHYETSDKRLVDAEMDKETVRTGFKSIAIAPMVALLGMILSLAIRGDSTFVYLMVPFMGTLGHRDN